MIGLKHLYFYKGTLKMTKEIKVIIEDGVFSDLQQLMLCKKISGSVGGVLDEFMCLLIQAIVDTKQELTVRRKNGS